MDELNGLVAVVTGGASGIGLATAQRLLAGGATVAALDMNPAGEPGSVQQVRADVTDQKSLDQAVATVIADHGRIDIVVNNAGIGAVGDVTDNDDHEWHRLYDVNVVGIVRTMRACLPHLRRSPAGAVVNVTSMAATIGLPLRACYSATKGAVLALTQAMAADLVGDGIRVNGVAPGTVDTPWVGRLLAAAPDPAAARSQLEARQPVGRLGTADEIAAMIVALASPSASFVTGSILAVDGGASSLRLPAQATRV